ncbi:MAG: hypothetical protein ACRDOS_06920 [Gaiellaceae bacterium]
MATVPQPDRVQRALLAALARNRGELDPAKLERLLRLLGPRPAN